MSQDTFRDNLGTSGRGHAGTRQGPLQLPVPGPRGQLGRGHNSGPEEKVMHLGFCSLFWFVLHSECRSFPTVSLQLVSTAEGLPSDTQLCRPTR